MSRGAWNRAMEALMVAAKQLAVVKSRLAAFDEIVDARKPVSAAQQASAAVDRVAVDFLANRITALTRSLR